MEDAGGFVVALALAGLVGGLVLLVRGLQAYTAGHRVAGVSTSRVASMPAGEVRLVGTVEADILTLVSPLQSVPCVYFRSRIREGTGDDATTVFSDERAVGFRLRDPSGTVRIFPRGARWDAPLRFNGATDWTGSEPAGLAINPGSSLQEASGVVDRDAQVAALLTVRPAGRNLPGGALDGEPNLLSTNRIAAGLAFPGTRRRDYDERRLEPGDIVTIVGSALPFGDLDDPAAADRLDATLASDDPEVSLNLAEARAAGILLASPEEAWGNAAIPGFGIGRPTRAPELDPQAAAPVLAAAGEAAAAESRFEIPAGELVLAATEEDAMTIVAGTPGEARARADARVLLGLAGAVLAIASALVLAMGLNGLVG